MQTDQWWGAWRFLAGYQCWPSVWLSPWAPWGWPVAPKGPCDWGLILTCLLGCSSTPSSGWPHCEWANKGQAAWPPARQQGPLSWTTYFGKSHIQQQQQQHVTHIHHPPKHSLCLVKNVCASVAGDPALSRAAKHPLSWLLILPRPLDTLSYISCPMFSIKTCLIWGP